MARLRGEMKRLCVALMIGSFACCLLGTFIVRSGVMASVHAFASDPGRGIAILAASAAIIAAAALLYGLRIERVCAGSGPALPMAGGDIVMTCGVYLLCVATVAVLIGTVYPLFHDMLGLGTLTVGAPYFNSFFAPMTVLAAGLIGLAHLMRVRHRAWTAAGCAAASVSVAGAVLALTTPRDAAITAAAVAGAVWIAVTLAVNAAAGRGRRMHASALAAHAAVAVCMLGATGATQYESEALVRMAPGTGRPLGDVIFVHTDTLKINTRTYFADAARIEVLRAGDESLKTVLLPMRQTFVSNGMQMSAAGIDHGFLADYYVSMGNRLSDTEWLVRLSVKPLVGWLWLGAAIMMLCGTALLVRPGRGPAQEQSAAGGEER